MKPGQFVNARVLVRTDRNVLTIPTAAVQLGPNGPFTYVVKSDSTVEVRPLKIGEESDGLTIVSGGLALHEQVVTSNQYRLQAGTLVRETWDVSQDKQKWMIASGSMPRLSERGMRATLERIAKLLES